MNEDTINKLIEKTEKGEINWDKTRIAETDSYSAIVQSHNIRLDCDQFDITLIVHGVIYVSEDRPDNDLPFVNRTIDTLVTLEEAINSRFDRRANHVLNAFDEIIEAW